MRLSPIALVAGGAAAVLAAGAVVATTQPERAPARPAAARGPAPAELASAAPSAASSRVPSARPSRAASKAGTPKLLLPLPAQPAPPRAGCPVPPWKGPAGKPKPVPPPAVADADLPSPLPVQRKAKDLRAVAGTGIWVTNWPKTKVDVPALVAKARSLRVDSIWVRTGGSRQGYYGDTVLPRLVPAAHAAGIRVIAWDFPFLSDPLADAERARRALATGIDAFAPDVETQAEGTYATSRRVALYLSHVRRYAGDRPVAATVPRPTDKRMRTFPYAAFQAYSDVFVPMVYWSCNEPGKLVEQSLSRLGRWLPVHPVGQAYDMGSEGGRRGKPSAAETWRFLDKAKRGGAVGASLWTIEQAGDGQLAALRGYPWWPGGRRH